MTFENDWCFRTAIKENVQKCICLEVWQLFIYQWQKHLSKKYPKNASLMSCCWAAEGGGPAELLGWAGTAASVSTFLQFSFAMWAATSTVCAEEWDLLCGRVQKAVLTSKSQDFTPVFSSVPTIWCTIINTAGSLLVQQTFNCDFMLLFNSYGGFGFHFLYQWSWKQGLTANKTGHTLHSNTVEGIQAN